MTVGSDTTAAGLHVKHPRPKLKSHQNRHIKMFLSYGFAQELQNNVGVFVCGAVKALKLHC